jgi:2,4-dienoyl-CoA reductase-like NADH-dependent reductase (Old Yellow Enzyme family)
VCSSDLSPLINKRTDEYGGTLEKRMKLAVDILKSMRAECGEDFIIGVRFGANEPSYAEGLFIAKLYEQNGIDYLSASCGYSLPGEKFDVPEDFPNNAIVYGGKLIHDNIRSVPVILVNEIKSIAQGEWLLQQDYGDMIAFGRPLLASGDMIARFKDRLPENRCLYCKSWCFWARNPELCPGAKK